jgi:hypothetical protein
MFLQNLIIKFLVVILCDYVQADKQEILEIWNMPISLWLTPSYQFYISFSCDPKIIYIEILMGYVVLI